MSESLQDLKKKLRIWKNHNEAKGLLSTSIKQNFYAANKFVGQAGSKLKWTCICRKSVGSNSIFCQNCIHWVYKRCSKIRGRLKAYPSFKCNACTNNIITISQDGQEVIIGNYKFEIVDSCYLGDSIGQSGSCFEATAETVSAAWKNCNSLLPVLTKSGTSLKVRGHAYSACICSVLLYASETWAVKVNYIHRLVRNDNALVILICSAKLCEKYLRLV